MIGGHHGGRANAVLNLTWAVLEDDEIVWPAQFQKNGKALRQPLTWDLIAALETARYWRRKALYKGPWILFGGTFATRGETRELDEWMKDPAHKRVGTGKGKPREVKDKPYSYSGLVDMLHKAEAAAGVEHKKFRAFHGTRKHSAGNIAEVTGDTRLALEWIGDDIRQAPRYLKRRENRLARAADAIETKGGK
jgi:integrase